MPSVHRIAGILLPLLSLATPLLGQSTPYAIKARLRERPLYIRNSWSDDTLYFDGNGDLTTPSKRSTFTLDGFTFGSLKLKDGVLTIKGGVAGVEFHDGKPKRIDLRAGRTVKIAAPANADFGPALDAIFADDLEALAPNLPEYWQQWARKTYPAAYPAAAGGNVAAHSGSVPVKKVGGAVSAPRILQQAAANFTPIAEALKYTGKTVVGFVVDVDGKTTQLSIVQPLGLGLDEAALSAVAAYRFTPTTENGQPVRVQLKVEIEFQIY